MAPFIGHPNPIPNPHPAPHYQITHCRATLHHLHHLQRMAELLFKVLYQVKLKDSGFKEDSGSSSVSTTCLRRLLKRKLAQMEALITDLILTTEDEVDDSILVEWLDKVADGKKRLKKSSPTVNFDLPIPKALVPSSTSPSFCSCRTECPFSTAPPTPPVIFTKVVSISTVCRQFQNWLKVNFDPASISHPLNSSQDLSSNSPPDFALDPTEDVKRLLERISAARLYLRCLRPQFAAFDLFGLLAAEAFQRAFDLLDPATKRQFATVYGPEVQSLELLIDFLRAELVAENSKRRWLVKHSKGGGEVGVETAAISTGEGCQYCQIQSHRTQQCPALARVLCFRCYQRGHTRRFCPRRTLKS